MLRGQLVHALHDTSIIKNHAIILRARAAKPTKANVGDHSARKQHFTFNEGETKEGPCALELGLACAHTTPRKMAQR